MLVNVAMAEVILALTKRGGDKRTMMVAGGALAFTFIYGLVRISMLESKMNASEAINVGIVQGNLGLMQQHTAPDESLRRHRKATGDLKKNGAGLVVWSESSVDLAADDRAINPFYQRMVTGNLGVPLIFGTVVIHESEKSGERERFYNTALATDETGKVTGRYDKEYLLAFGEYLPLGETFPALYDASPNSGRFSSGTKLDPLPITTSTGTHNVATLICYEDIIPTFVNDLVRATDPELLVNITNDAWFGVTAEPFQHLALAQMRAIEHRRYLIRSTNSGVSAIIDPVGRIVRKTEVRDVQTRIKEPDTAQADVRWMKGWTLYGGIGDLPWYPVALLSIAGAFRRRSEQSKKS
jgi:apolipoprotein N-acyltransferase